MKRILIACASTLLIASACGGSGDTSPGSGGSAGSGGASGNAGSSGGKAGGAGSGSGGSSAGTGGVNFGGWTTGGSDSGGPNAGGANAGGAGGGSFACGSETCGANQYCINPCCGGAPQPCFNRGDAGTCPAGSVQGCNYPSGECPDVAFCCMPLPCDPPPPYCADELLIGCFLQGRNCLMLCA